MGLGLGLGLGFTWAAPDLVVEDSDLGGREGWGWGHFGVYIQWEREGRNRDES